MAGSRELVLFSVLWSCHPEPEIDVCEDSVLDWDSFGEPFVRSWCTGCHSASLAEADRQGAPLGVDFDTLTGVWAEIDGIRNLAVDGRSMPPAGGPGDDARALLGEWIGCGAPGQDQDPIPPEPEPETTPTGACGREGRWVLVGASCAGDDVTQLWSTTWPETELQVTSDDEGCAIDFRRADAGCLEVQQWRSTMTAPSAPFLFLGTVDCEPSACTFAADPDDTCVVPGAAGGVQVAIGELEDDQLIIGPFDPPDVPFCTSGLRMVVRRTGP